MGGYKLDFPSWLSFTPLKQICTNYLCTIGPLMLFKMLVKWFPKQIICYVNMNIKWIIGIGIIQISLLLFKATLHLYFFSFNLKSCTIELTRCFTIYCLRLLFYCIPKQRSALSDFAAPRL